jgi:colicin import membrane protein
MGRALELLTDACAALDATARKMFGGHGFFAPNGGMFAGIVTDDEVILKLVEGPLRDELIGLGGHPWTYEGHGRPMTMKQWIVVPERFYDDPELLAEWAAKAHAAVPAKTQKAARAAQGKPSEKNTRATKGTASVKGPRSAKASRSAQAASAGKATRAAKTARSAKRAAAAKAAKAAKGTAAGKESASKKPSARNARHKKTAGTAGRKRR